MDGNYAEIRYRLISEEKYGTNNLSTAFPLNPILIPIHIKFGAVSIYHVVYTYNTVSVRVNFNAETSVCVLI